MRHHRPGRASVLVGQGDGGDLGRSAVQKLGKPRSARVTHLFGPPDYRESPNHQDHSQITVTRLGDVPEALLAARRVLPWHQAYPGRQITARFEGMRIGARGSQSGCNQGTDTGNVIKALTDFAHSMPGKNAAIRIEDLMLHHLKLIAQGQQAVARGGRHPVIIAILDDLQQPLQPIAADACDNTELSQMGTQGIDQRGALADEQMAGPV